jgi:hypothetical protein
MGTYDPKTLNNTEKLKILKRCIVREAGAEAGRHVKTGDIVSMKGVEKAELLIRDLAVIAKEDKNEKK